MRDNDINGVGRTLPPPAHQVALLSPKARRIRWPIAAIVLGRTRPCPDLEITFLRRRRQWRPHPDQQSKLLFRVRDDAPNGGEQGLELDRFDIEFVAARGNGLLALAR